MKNKTMVIKNRESSSYGSSNFDVRTHSEKEARAAFGPKSKKHAETPNEILEIQSSEKEFSSEASEMKKSRMLNQ